MSAEQCFMGLCFIPLDSNGPKIFGFSEFLAGLALMVLAWTIADVRYRFRVRIAPIPLQGITYAVVAAVGILTLLTDLWRAEQWLVPEGNVLTPASWQALLGGLFLLTFLTWVWFAFIRPPIYGRRNVERFARTLYRIILKGFPAELAVIADELGLSARALVRHATNLGEHKNYGTQREDTKPPKVEAYANDLLLLIADKRFCRAIVESAPGTAMAVFQEMDETKKYGIRVETFAKNIVNEALKNRDSFIFHEAEGYESGLIGYYKPLSQAMFGNYRMVETVDSLLDLDMSNWDADQWEAYCRIVLMTFRDYVEEGHGGDSYVLYRAKGYIERAASDLYKLNGVANAEWDDDALSRLRVVVKFIADAVEVLDKKGVPNHLQLRSREENRRSSRENFYDYLAGMIFETIFAASSVTSPRDYCWWVQHNTVWNDLFRFRLDNAAGKVVKFKARRLLYNEIADMKKFPNFKGAKILGFCLNVMGFNLRESDIDKSTQALHKAVLAWTRKNYTWLHNYNPRVAEACLVDGMTHDPEKRRLVKTYPAEGLRREPHYVYLDLNPAQVDLGAEAATL
jgi:hypothetical protein